MSKMKQQGKTAATPKKKTGGTHHVLRREFGDLEIIEGFAPLRLQPMQCDAETAVVKDPKNCVFSRTAARQYGATKVIFWKTFAYVDLVGKDGVRHVERFVVPKTTFDLIEKFDRGEPFEVGRAFHLIVPPRHLSRKALSARSAARARTPAGRTVRAAYDAKAKYKAAGLRLEREETRLQDIRADTNPQSDKVKLASQRVASAKLSLRDAKTEFDHRFKAAEKVRAKKHRDKQQRKPQTFDLSVRNGQHHYNFTKRELPSEPGTASGATG
jgi:hypothetical protein